MNQHMLQIYIMSDKAFAHLEKQLQKAWRAICLTQIQEWICEFQPSFLSQGLVSTSLETYSYAYKNKPRYVIQWLEFHRHGSSWGYLFHVFFFGTIISFLVQLRAIDLMVTNALVCKLSYARFVPFFVFAPSYF